MNQKKPAETALSIVELQQGLMTFNLLGTSPLFYHRFAVKAWHELLYPSGRKTAADKAGSMKHDPIEEYRQSVYAHHDNDHPTRFYFPGAAFRRAMASAALRIPGVTKTEIGQLTWLEEFKVDVYGLPSLSMMMVRMSDQTRTPDVRTRLVLDSWACRINVRYAKPLLNERTIGNLIAAAGQIMGIGDGRGEKGIFHFGAFDVVAENDPRWLLIVKKGGRAAQDSGLEAPEFFDPESEELFGWFYDEVQRRTQAVKIAKPKITKPKAPRQRAKKENGKDVVHA